MEYKQFIEKIVQQVTEKIDIDYQVCIQKVLRNNNIELDGMMILKEGETMVPNIYLNELFIKYKKGENLEGLSDEIIQTIHKNHNLRMTGRIKNLHVLHKQKDRIIFRIVNYESNKTLLETIPFIKFLDLAIIFYCLVEQNEEGIGAVRITEELASKWKITKNELFCIANENTPKLFPAVLRSMKEVVEGLIKGEEVKQYTLNNLEGVEQSILDLDYTLERLLLEENYGMPMFILTNSMGINGASVLLYKSIIKKISFQCNADLYILPSSIHEVIIIPNRGNLERKQLEEMVKEINVTQVPLDEVLSNQVYLYKRKSNSFV